MKSVLVLFVMIIIVGIGYLATKPSEETLAAQEIESVIATQKAELAPYLEKVKLKRFEQEAQHVRIDRSK